MTDQQQPPLWDVMRFSRWDANFSPQKAYAAELRAIANRVVPAREFPDGKDDIQKGIWLACDRIRQHLMDEADRVEAGE